MNRSTIAISVFLVAALAFAAFRVTSYVQANRQLWERDAQERSAERDREAYANRITSIEDSLRQSGVKAAIPCKGLDGFAFSLNSTELNSTKIDDICLHFQVLRDAAPGVNTCLLYTSPSPRDATLSRMPSSA